MLRERTINRITLIDEQKTADGQTQKAFQNTIKENKSK